MVGFNKTQPLPTLERMSMQALPDVIRDIIISSGIWPAHSPCFNPCNVFPLGLFEGQNLQQ
jgi:hypothetical protein